MELEGIRRLASRLAIGLMSGSSCDGVDAAVVRIKGSGPDLRAELLGFETAPYPKELRRRLLRADFTAAELCALNVELGERFADAALRVMKTQGGRPDFIASHGHTVAHRPPGPGVRWPGALQIGEAAVIAERCGTVVVSNFRPRDMAAGGQGAPLVPYADWVLFRGERGVTACLNIGGIANLTVVTPRLEEVVAFDTGPGNMPIDALARALTDGERDYDADGAMAAEGRVVPELLEPLLAHPFLKKAPPKSTGREDFGPEVYLRGVFAARERYAAVDLVSTVTEAVAASIAAAVERFVASRHTVARVVVSGGGAHNGELMRRLCEKLRPVPVMPSGAFGIPVDAKEAVAFAILGSETICGRPSNAPAATGARKAVVLGTITPA